MTSAEQGTLRFSIIVASRNRPAGLARCLCGLRQQDYADFEIVVVADPASSALVDGPDIKCIRFDRANLSAARNLGIVHSAGDICVFIDDDAVAEPTWLTHLAYAFQTTRADALVGYARGRNGISFQSESMAIDAEAETHREHVSAETPTIPVLSDGRVTKLIGTNMAIRRSVLLRLHGFDERYRFFLEDADLSMRLAASGATVGVAPLAVVYHGFAASARRTSRRAPLDLFDIARSTAFFQRRFSGHADETFKKRVEKREFDRMVRHMVAGTCEPRDVGIRMRQLEAGWSEGCGLSMSPVPALPDPSHETAFRPIKKGFSGHSVLASMWYSQRAGLVRSATEIVQEGGRASIFSFSLTPIRHHVRYVEPGIWLQTGGLFGRSDRSGPAIRWCRFAERLSEEIRRVAKTRGLGETPDR